MLSHNPSETPAHLESGGVPPQFNESTAHVTIALKGQVAHDADRPSNATLFLRTDHDELDYSFHSISGSNT